MAELQDWLRLDLQDEEREIVEEFFRIRPDWLAISSPSKYQLARIEPICEGVEAIEVDLDECSVFWGGWHEHFVGWAGTVRDAIDAVEAILDERAVRVVARDEAGKWYGAVLCRPEDVETSKLSVRFGIPPSLDPEALATSTVAEATHRVVTSWRGAYSRTL